MRVVAVQAPIYNFVVGAAFMTVAAERNVACHFRAVAFVAGLAVDFCFM